MNQRSQHRSAGVRAIDALVTAGPGAGFALTPCWLDEPRDHEVLVRIVAVGVCHTDLGVAAGYLPSLPFPAVLGHEGAGIVEAAGPGVEHVVVGDHVVITGPRCLTCRFCRDGRPAYCQHADELVFSCQRADGSTSLSYQNASERGGHGRIASHFFGQSSFATYAVANAAGVVTIDRSMPLHLAAPIGCGVVTGWGTVVNHLRVRTGETVAVIGFGGVGSAAAAAALSVGANVVVVEPSQHKRVLAESLGAVAVSSEGESAQLIADVHDATGGGADHVVCTIGDVATVEQSVAMAGRNGAIAIVGGSPPGSRISFDATDLLFSGKRISGVRMGEMIAQRDIPALVAAWDYGSLPLEQFVTTFRLDQIAEATERVARGETIKAVLLPDHETPTAATKGSDPQ